MTWIDVIDRDEAEGLLAEIYDRNEMLNEGTTVPNIVKVGSLLPGILEKWNELFMELMYRNRESSLGRAQREMIATWVSVRNECEY